MPWMHLTCGACGHRADIDEFTRTPVAGDLPANVYQCPACRHAVERKVIGPGQRFDNGHYIPGPIALVPVDSRL